MNTQRDELEDYGSNMQNAWEGGIGNFEDTLGGNSMKFDGEGLPILGDYVFGMNHLTEFSSFSHGSTEKNNKCIDPTTSRSLLDDAKALLDQNGSLSEAALMLEAAIQQGELGEGGYETWILLGETRNMDEREDAGMRALLEGVKRAEANGGAGSGMLVCNQVNVNSNELTVNSHLPSLSPMNPTIVHHIQCCCTGLGLDTPMYQCQKKRSKP